MTKPTLLVKAQEPDKAKTSVVLRKGFQEVSTWVWKSADMVPAEKYNYKPVDTVRTFGQIIGHITDSYNYYCAQGAGTKVEWADPAEKGNTDKATLVPKLKEALDKCNAAYAADNGQLASVDGEHRTHESSLRQPDHLPSHDGNETSIKLSEAPEAKGKRKGSLSPFCLGNLHRRFNPSLKLYAVTAT
jgi:hypothetical protein